jgi:hypothetical protein
MIHTLLYWEISEVINDIEEAEYYRQLRDSHPARQ